MLVAVRIVSAHPGVPSTAREREAMQCILERELLSLEIDHDLGVVASMEATDPATALERVAAIYGRAIGAVTGRPFPPVRGRAGQIQRRGQRERAAHAATDEEGSHP